MPSHLSLPSLFTSRETRSRKDEELEDKDYWLRENMILSFIFTVGTERSFRGRGGPQRGEGNERERSGSRNDFALRQGRRYGRTEVGISR